ncbi:MAG: four helix bundle protein [Crocinitomicaceae bacterium]
MSILIRQPNLFSMKRNILLEKSFDFALMSIRLAQSLQNRNEYILSKQIMRSGTSVGANIREANNTISKKDFIYKLNIAQKECDESLYWAELLQKCEYISDEQFYTFQELAIEQLRILKSSILTAKKNLNQG